MTVRIFVSYAKYGGLDLAKDIKRFFEERTYSVFVADEDIGTVPAVLEGVPVSIQVFNPRNRRHIHR